MNENLWHHKKKIIRKTSSHARNMYNEANQYIIRLSSGYLFLFLTVKMENDFRVKSRQNPMVIVSISKFKHLFLFPVYDEID